jgi:transcriptional regulator with XRE-family HTH domain
MVPKRVGDELRRRRLLLNLRQTDIAQAMSTTRAYVSAVELGVDWDPDADKLVVWAQTLGWPGDYILRALGRAVISTTEPVVVTADLMAAIRRAVAEGVAEGVVEALQDRQGAAGGRDPAHGGPLPGLPLERPA